MEINRIIKETNINRYVKVLDGRSIFYLMPDSLMESRRNNFHLSSFTTTKAVASR